jgi:hypothetical protein
MSGEGILAGEPAMVGDATSPAEATPIWTGDCWDDICECGDFRRDHPSDGPCNFNKGKGGIGHSPALDCQGFRLSRTGDNPITPTPRGEQR